MANTIRNKYSEVTATPSSLADGELAYSKLSNSLFIGQNGDGTVVKVGGKADVDKLAGIEAGATADQTGAEIKALYEAEANAFTDAQFTKLAGIEAGADVTDATNVDAAGAVMLTDTDASTMSFVIDEDNMVSNSATKVPTQQSVKQYVDTEIAGLASGSAFQGDYDASTNTPDLDTSPSGITVGDYYVVSVAGTFFSTAVEAGDLLFAKQTDPTTEAHWAIANRNIDSSAFATAAQGALADSAVQPGDNISDLTNDSGFIANVVEDTTPQLGGNLDLNGNEIYDADGNKILGFEGDASAVNNLVVSNGVAGADPHSLTPMVKLATEGADGRVMLGIYPKDTVGDGTTSGVYINGDLFVHGSGKFGGSTLDTLIQWNSVSSTVDPAENYLKISNAHTGYNPVIEADGSDTDIDLSLSGKGAGVVSTQGGLSVTNAATIGGNIVLGGSGKVIAGRSTDVDVQTDIRIYNESGDGRLKMRNTNSAYDTVIQHYLSTNAVASEYRVDEAGNSVTISNPLGYDFVINGFTLTNTDGSDNQVLTTDGSGNLAFETVSSVTEGAVTAHQAALSITESQISDLGSYLTAETNDLTAAVTWANVPDANITQSSVTQHEAALSIATSQLTGEIYGGTF